MQAQSPKYQELLDRDANEEQWELSTKHQGTHNYSSLICAMRMRCAFRVRCPNLSLGISKDISRDLKSVNIQATSILFSSQRPLWHHMPVSKAAYLTDCVKRFGVITAREYGLSRLVGCLINRHLYIHRHPFATNRSTNFQQCCNKRMRSRMEFLKCPSNCRKVLDELRESVAMMVRSSSKSWIKT